MAEKTEIEVLLDGRIYKVSGYESVEYMQKIANYINAKERDLKANGNYNRIPNALRSYLMYINIADDYFKAKQEAEALRAEVERKDKELYGIKHEAAELQTKISRLKKGEDPEEAAHAERTTGGAIENHGFHPKKQKGNRDA